MSKNSIELTYLGQVQQFVIAYLLSNNRECSSIQLRDAAEKKNYNINSVYRSIRSLQKRNIISRNRYRKASVFYLNDSFHYFLEGREIKAKAGDKVGTAKKQ